MVITGEAHISIYSIILIFVQILIMIITIDRPGVAEDIITDMLKEEGKAGASAHTAQLQVRGSLLCL